MNRAVGVLRNPAARLLVPFADLRGDLLHREMHVHTLQTDGQASIEELIADAERLGLTLLVFTEHVRADSDWFVDFAARVRKAARGAHLEVLVGAEVRISDFHGGLDISPAIRRHCDLVLASVHRFPGVNGESIPFGSVDRETFCATEYELALGLLRCGEADILAHCGGMSLRHLGHFPTLYFRNLMREARASGTAIEINSAYLTDLAPFLKLLAEINPLVSIGSDVHHLIQLGDCSRRLTRLL